MYNIIMDFREIGWNGMNWIDLTHDRDQWRALVNTVMNHTEILGLRTLSIVQILPK
jgi:hypothetical protein